ncbi:MAG: lysoplasmalogenase [Chitinophagaceae bacterium]|nr:lysoplasmalogenase [Chitinophagaceae bacterium]
MKPKDSKWLLYLFIIDLIAELVAIFWNFQDIRYLTKPLLLLLLLFYVITHKIPYSKGKWLLIAALFFSWMGDLFLLFDSKQPNFFIFGLLSFLTAHIFYIVIFIQLKKLLQPNRKWNPIIFLLLLLYTGSLFALLYPTLGVLKIPVIIYAGVLTSMLLVAAHSFNWQTSIGKWVIAGALLFVASDSLLAINKFYQPFNAAGLAIMTSYGLAQLFIVIGLTKCMRSANKA